jgi:type I site-specific restriction endonuclease
LLRQAYVSPCYRIGLVRQAHGAFKTHMAATPNDEIDNDTYSLFSLKKGVPRDSYDLDDAVDDGYLVPPKTTSVPLKFQRDGIA